MKVSKMMVFRVLKWLSVAIGILIVIALVDSAETASQKTSGFTAIILTVEGDPSDPKIILPVKQTFRQQIARMFSKSLIEVRYMIPTAERAMGTLVT